jgi:Recombination endonuclease VII
MSEDGLKRCNKCGERKPLDEFYRSNTAPDGRQYRCKKCSISAARQWQIDHPEAAREADRRYKQTDKNKAKRKERREGPQRERILGQKRESWYRNHDSNLDKLRERQADPEFRAKQRERYEKWRKNDPRGVTRISIGRLYGLTLDDWDRMLIEQLGCCAICNEAVLELHVDHCHESDIVRGLLCTSCNNGLGRFGDDPERLRRAADYIEKYRRDPAA